ncbi:hypothetical protein LWI29_004236 [Acer saccharum]|uniref:DUF1421 domain-containing protein n=1 Tax=Acer saccharum TaxID=4024 RepID=A0AA39SBI2_ACESA|nr:hypothetical protein LWI29_004236 [Acer saccharum]
MNTSQFMDKQIMDLNNNNNNNNNINDDKEKDGDSMDLVNHPPKEDDNYANNGIGIKKEEIVPSYDFQPIRGGLSQSFSSDSVAPISGPKFWNSADNNNSNSASSPAKSYHYLVDSCQPKNFSLGNDKKVSDAAIVSEIDQTMKKYADNLLHVLEGVSARLTQLETRTRNLENSVDDLKVSVENNHGSTDEKMKQMENIMREVQSGVQVLKDKQETLEAQLQLAKLQVSNVDQQFENHSTGNVDAMPQAASAPQQSHVQPPYPPPVSFTQSLPPLPAPIVPPPAPQQSLPPPVHLPNQFPQSQVPSGPQREPYFSPPGQTQDVPNPQYQVPPTQQQHPPSAAPPYQPYQAAPQPQYSQAPQQPPQHQSSLGHHPEEMPYIPSQSYPPSLRQPASQPPSGSAPSQPYYSAPPSHMYESPSNRSGAGFPTGYGLPSGPSEPYPSGGPPSQYGGGSTMKPQQLSPAMSQTGGNSYPQLPSARVLPHAVPTASGVSGGSVSSGTGNRVPLDDVIDRVTTMGFPRDHVRATVRKMTESGQSVDLNMVLDKLMNDGEVQPPRGWFNR